MSSDNRCEETGKYIYTNQHAARSQQRTVTSKRMRIYRCQFHPTHFHATSAEANRTRTEKKLRRKR